MNTKIDIHQAILRKDYKAVESLLKNKVSPNKQTGNKNTPLHIAVMKKHLPIIKLLKCYSADPNLKNFHDSTPLHIASYKKNGIKTVNLLLNMGANANEVDRYGNTALHIAARSHGNVETIKALVDAGANTKIMNNNAETAFSIAQKNNHISCMELLKFKESKFRSSILKALTKSFYRTNIIKKIALISFSLAVLSITIIMSIATSGKTVAGILCAIFAILGMTVVCLEEKYHELQETEKETD